MSSMNVIILMGRITATPELKHTPSGVPVCTFSIAVDRPKANNVTDFFNVTAWRNNDEFVCKYFRKGQLMEVHGRLTSRKYTDGNDNKRTAIEIVADQVSFCGSRNDNTEHRPEQRPQTQAAAQDEDLIDDDDNPVFGNDEYEQISYSDGDLPFGE